MHMKTRFRLIIGALLAILASSCSDGMKEDLSSDKSVYLTATIDDGTFQTRTTISPNGDIYNVHWQENDCIAVFADKDTEFSKFSLVSGANSSMGVFRGVCSQPQDSYLAIYPYDVVQGRSANAITLEIGATQLYQASGISPNSLLMYACGKPGSLNFYNLGSVLRLQLTGRTMLKSVTVSSNDDRVIAGEATLAFSDNQFPEIAFGETGSREIVLDCDGIVLEENRIKEMNIVIPYGTYESGLTLTFNTYAGTFTKTIDRSVTFERAQIRSVKPFVVEGEMPSPEMRSERQLWYKTKNGKRCSIAEGSAFNAAVISHTYSNDWGIVCFDKAPTRINGRVFAEPESITELYLPESVEYIGMYAFSGVSVTEINFPKSLESLGVDAFSQCKGVKSIVVPEGVRSLGLEVFGGCTALEYVTLPSTLEVTEPYAFLNCDNLVRFIGDTKFISPDGRCFFTNSAYGAMSEPETLDKVAGKGLETYTLPDNVLYLQNYAMSGCNELRELTIHENVKSCAADPFPLSGNLKIVNVQAVAPPYIQFDHELKGIETIYVPEESVMLYQSAEGWSYLRSLIRAGNW